jgi:hypothetical protein
MFCLEWIYVVSLVISTALDSRLYQRQNELSYFTLSYHLGGLIHIKSLQIWVVYLRYFNRHYTVRKGMTHCTSWPNCILSDCECEYVSHGLDALQRAHPTTIAVRVV